MRKINGNMESRDSRLDRLTQAVEVVSPQQLATNETANEMAVELGMVISSIRKNQEETVTATQEVLQKAADQAIGLGELREGQRQQTSSVQGVAFNQQILEQQMQETHSRHVKELEILHREMAVLMNDNSIAKDVSMDPKHPMKEEPSSISGSQNVSEVPMQPNQSRERERVSGKGYKDASNNNGRSRCSDQNNDAPNIPWNRRSSVPVSHEKAENQFNTNNLGETRRSEPSNGVFGGASSYGTIPTII